MGTRKKPKKATWEKRIAVMQKQADVNRKQIDKLESQCTRLNDYIEDIRARHKKNVEKLRCILKKQTLAYRKQILIEANIRWATQKLSEPQ